MSQDYFEGEVYENLIRELLRFYNIDLKLYSYKENPEIQNDGIDGKIINPSDLNGISIQVKMFRNSEKYQTFPWEVSRFLINDNKFVYEPHKSDFHILIDPIDNLNNIKCIIWIIKTGGLPKYYRNLWVEAIDKFGDPHIDNTNWKIKEGKIEPYFFKTYKNETLYQLIKKHTASQRNVRFRLDRMKKNFLKFNFLIPNELLSDIKQKKYHLSSHTSFFKKYNNQKINLISFFRSNNQTKL